MSNDINHVGNVIEISGIDENWSWSDTFPNLNEIRLQSIKFDSDDADDICWIKNGSTLGPRLFRVKIADEYDQRYQLYDGIGFMPVLDFDAGTYSSGAVVTIIIKPHR